ncbi:MurR/RpiR family transcriptional regulator [Pelagibius sp.]|uniref:MurR/RpiR family transcriptional regulator n=1 Tax=Pelagibius sp. TaxID=1931238 RepID=UPI003BAF73D8
MKLRDIVEKYDGRLTGADRKLISVLLSDPKGSAYLSVHDLAKAAGVHGTSAVRLAQKLGFNGYPEMRAQLRDQLTSDGDPALRVRQRLDKMGDGSLLEAVIESEIEALRDVPTHIAQEQIDAAVDALMAAKEIRIFGRGHASALVDLLTRRLTRSGYQARGFKHIDWETPEQITPLEADDVLISFAFRSIPAGLQELMSFAVERGVRCIVISDLIGPIIRPKPDILLAASRGPEGTSQSLTVPMAICNVLILELSRQDDGKSMRSLERLADTNKRLGKRRGETDR